MDKPSDTKRPDVPRAEPRTVTAVPRPRTTTVRPTPPPGMQPATQQPPQSTSKPSVRRKRLMSRGLQRRILRTLAVTTLVLGVIIGGLAFRLSQGPIPLNFAKSTFESALAGSLQNHTVRMGDLALAYGDNGPMLQLRNVAVVDGKNGPVLLQVPSANITISKRALLSGHLAVHSVELTNPRLQVFYADNGALSLKFQKSTDTSDPADKRSPPKNLPGEQPRNSATVDPTEPVDLVKTITTISAQARAREHATAFLRNVTLKDATVLVDNGVRKSLWRVPEFNLDLNHKRSRSLISGRAVIASLTGPWSIDFASDEAADSRQLVVNATVAGLNPRGVARQLPALGAFEPLDVPLDGKTRIVISSTGMIESTTFEMTARPGRLYAAGFNRPALDVSEGSLGGSYDAARQRIEIPRATLGFEDNRIELTATLDAVSKTALGARVWQFDARSTSGHFANPNPKAPPIPLDMLAVRGQALPDHGRVLVQQVLLRAGGGEVTAKASVDDSSSTDVTTAGIEGRISPMPAARLLTLWPRAVLPDVRAWLASHLTKGQLTGGQFKISAASALSSASAPPAETEVSLTLETTGLEIAARDAWPRIDIPRALVRVEGGTLEVTAPDVLAGPDNRRIALKAARFTAVGTSDGRAPVGELAFRVQGSALTLAEILDREPNRHLKTAGITASAIDGKLDGQLKLTFPLAHNVEATEVRTEGRIRISDGRLKGAIGKDDISGGKFDIDISDKAIDAHGEMLLSGVPLRIVGQHFLNTAHDKQPPIRITANLDNADRNQLGLDINDIVQGEVPVEILVQRDAKGDFKPRVRADLTKADLNLDSMAWRKPPGKPASFQFEPAKVSGGRLELQNVKLSGETIAAEGTITIGADNKPKEFTFPEFSLNVVSRLEVHGKMRPDNIWDIRAKGTTFDGRDLFRDLFNVGDKGQKLVPKTKPGLDLNAEIDNVLGFSETNLRNVRIVLQRRNEGGNEKTHSLDVIAQHANGKPFQAQIRNEPRVGRRLAANSEDAGLTFKAVGFYPNAVGGRMGLEMLLDGRASIERSGNLVATNFAVLGDPVVSEVFQNTDGTAPAPGKKKIVRQQIDFDWMRMPFSIGSGQLVMNDGQIKGPLLGATMRGKIDFKAQTLNINGTYAPLSGLNSALSGIPIVGALMTGPKGEGIFGITFEVSGPTANPNVIVNPFSMLTIGATRELMQMGPENYRITPRAEPLPPQRGDAARASSAPPTTQGRATPPAGPRAGPQTISDWNSDPAAAPPAPKPKAPREPTWVPPNTGQQQ